MKESNLSAVIEQRRIHFDAVAFGDLLRRATTDVDAPQMTPIDIVLVGREDDERFVRRKRDVLNFVLAGRQRCQRPAIGRNRIEMTPALLF